MAKPRKIKHLRPGMPVSAAAVRVLRARIKEFYSHWPDPEQTPEAVQLHNLRISGKRLRYSAENLRELYPGRLSFLIDLLKRGQDSLGEMQDCETQRTVIETEIARVARRNAAHPELPALQALVAEYRERQAVLLAQFREIWHAMALPEVQASLLAMTARPRTGAPPVSRD